MVYIDTSSKMFLFGGAGANVSAPYGDQWYFNCKLNIWREVDKIHIPLTISAIMCLGFISLAILKVYRRKRKLKLN